MSLSLTLGLAGCSSNAAPTAESTEGPLSKYLSVLWANDENSNEKMVERSKEAEEIVSKCMSDAGFEYNPYPLTNEGIQDLTDRVNQDSDNYAQQYGYGLAASHQSDSDNTSATQQDDPNAEYFSALSTSEQEAYIAALWGEPVTETGTTEGESAMQNTEYDWKAKGCQGAAQHKTMKSATQAEAALNDPAFADLFMEINDYYSKSRSNESPTGEIAQMYRKWNECMTHEGHSEFPSPPAALRQLTEEYNALAPTGGAPGEKQQPTKDELLEFTEREMSVAVADKNCQENVGYEKTMKKSELEFEKDFVQRNKQQLDALVASYSSKKK